jgi:hypothetical protein
MQINEVSKMTHEQIQHSFPVGCKVTMTPLAKEQFTAYAKEVGTVLGYLHGNFPKVKFEGKKTVDGWHPDFLMRIDQ